MKNRLDFSDILFDALMSRIRIFIEENNSEDLGVGQIPCWGLKKNEPSGKPLDQMEKIRVKLTLHHPY